MIVVDIVFFEGDDNRIKTLFTKGHSLKDRKDICASVSTLEYTFLYSLKILSGIDFEFEVKDGFFRINVINVDKNEEELYNHLCCFYMIGIKNLETENKDLLKVKGVFKNGIKKR